jgi:hypothetical protein
VRERSFEQVRRLKLVSEQCFQRSKAHLAAKPNSKCNGNKKKAGQFWPPGTIFRSSLFS